MSLLFEVLANLLSYFDLNSLWLFKLILIADLFYFIWFYYILDINTNWIKTYSIVIFLIVIFILLLFLLRRLINVEISFGSFFFMTIFVFFILQNAIVVLNIFDKPDLNPSSNFLFWITFARMMYFLIIFLIYIYPNLLESNVQNQCFWNVFNVINALGNIICNILYGISFLCVKINK